MIMDACLILKVISHDSYDIMKILQDFQNTSNVEYVELHRIYDEER